MTGTCVLDACALIALLNDEEGVDKVEGLLRQAAKKTMRVLVHEINLLEVYYGVYRTEGEEKASQVLQGVRDLPITIVEGLSSRVFFEAGRLKATYRISLADAIALAVAADESARLATADHHEFDVVEEKEKGLSFLWIR